MNEYRFSMDAAFCFSVRAETEEQALAKAKDLIWETPDEGVTCDITQDGISIAGCNPGAIFHLDFDDEPECQAFFDVASLREEPPKA